MIQPVISKSGYTYIYSSYINSILLSPSENEYVDIDRCKFLNDAGLVGCLCNFTNK